MPERVNVAIVGAGPAGIGAAIYLKRAGWEPLLFDEREPGGLLREANLVENYPGFPHGITGAELASLLAEHMNRLKVRFVNSPVLRITKEGQSFILETETDTFASQAAILATGTSPKKMMVEGLDKVEGKRLFYGLSSVRACETEGKHVVVLGGGDAALDYAINMSERGNVVRVISRSTPSCLQLLLERAKARGIEITAGCTPERIEELEEGVKVICRNDNETEAFACDLVIVAHGREPRLDALDHGLRDGVLNSGDSHPVTSIEGLFVAGDVIRGRSRQTAIAVGDGVFAAMLVDRLLKDRRGAEK